MKITSLLFLLFTFSLPSFSQQRTYSIEVAGVHVGKMTAKRTNPSPNQHQYELTSKVRVNLLVFVLEVGYHVNSLFLGKQPHLVKSMVQAKTNKGAFKTSTELVREFVYQITSEQPKKQISKQEKGKIDWTVSRLFFEEPISQNRIYAEYYGDFLQIIPLGGGRYKTILDKNEDIYTYINGELTHITKKNPLKDFKIILQD
ncbi:MAG: DUF6134 family protein [Spirosomataceae bacterium]